MDELKEQTIDVNQSDFAHWTYSGEMHYDPLKPQKCTLCKRKSTLRFKVKNRTSAKYIYVGRECILKINLSLNDSNTASNADDIKSSTQKSAFIVNKEFRQQRAMNSLFELAKVDKEVNVDSLLQTFEENGAFSPNQMFLLNWRFEYYSIKFLPEDFKLTIKKSAHRQQLMKMAYWKIQKIWPIMTPNQRGFYKTNRWRYKPGKKRKRPK